MADSPIAHVSDTALWVAACRALESERPDALFRDPLAARLAGERGHEIARKMRGQTARGWSVAVRTSVIDDLLRENVAAGVDTILNLGAGLDTRPYRLELPASLRWVEVDYPNVIELKENALQGEQARCRLERVALDLTERERRRAFLQGLASESRRILVLTEGVLPYLSVDEVGSLADDLRACPAIALWITDFFAPELMRHLMRRPPFRNAPFRFNPPDWQRFFGDHGFGVRDLRYLGEHSVRLGRKQPLPLVARLFCLFKPSLRQKVQRVMGYALLEVEARSTR